MLTDKGKRLLKMSNIETVTRQEKLDTILSLMTITTEPSDKIGSNWKIVKLGDTVISKEYITDESAKGTKENPYTDDTILVDNAYYIIDNVKYVYMSGQLVEFDF